MRNDLAADHGSFDAQSTPVGGDLAVDHLGVDTQMRRVDGDLPPDQPDSDTHMGRVGGTDLAADQRKPDTQARLVGGDLAIDQARTDTHGCSVDGDLPPDQARRDTHLMSVGGKDLAVDHLGDDTHRRCVGGNPLPPARAGASPIALPSGEVSSLDQGLPVPQQGGVEREPPRDQRSPDAQNGSVAWGLLTIYAELVDDAEKVRVATVNRLRLLGSPPDHVKKPEIRAQYKCLDGTPEEARLQHMVQLLKEVENMAILDLKRALRKHPLGAWVKRTVGVGEKQGARLLAEIGDPGRRRTVSQLWAYCGLDPRDGKAARRTKGVRSNWNDSAKMRARLVADSCQKQRHSPYRPIYDRERAKWATRDTTDLHRHNHALRVVAKEVLKDLWRESRDQASGATQATHVARPAEDKEATA